VNDISVKIKDVSKTYRVYEKPKDRLMQFIFRSKIFYKEFIALNTLSFDIKKGETIGIIGRNGSGKSTLLQMIAGTLTPATGDIQISGRVAALLELGSGFNPEFTGRENVYLNASILGITREEIEQKMDAILKFADIGDFIDQPVKTYSSGMYVRLAFSVSINVDPEILIVDEALAVGDGRFQLKCFEKIKDLKDAGKTIIVVTHDMQTVRQICDRVVLIDRGQLLNIGKPNEIVNEYTKVLFSGISVVEESVASSIEPVSEENTATFKGADSGSEIVISKEYRYGNNEGKIEKIIYPTDHIGGIVTLTSSDEYVIGYKAKAYRKIERPIYAMTVKTVKGLDVYGTNTYFQGMDFKPLENNEEVIVTFSQKMNLLPGDYFISFGFVELIDGEVIPLDRRYDVIELKIMPKARDRSFGLANLESEIKVD